MFKLDDNLLQELGLGVLPANEKNKMLGHIYETLEMRVGMKLAEQMTNEQLDEFEAYIDRNDEPGALKWLETNFPGYKQVVADELEKLKTEIKSAAPQIVAASQADPANQAAMQAQMAAQQQVAPGMPAPGPQPMMPPIQPQPSPMPQPMPAQPVMPQYQPVANIVPPVPAPAATDPAASLAGHATPAYPADISGYVAPDSTQQTPPAAAPANPATIQTPPAQDTTTQQ